MDTIPAQATKLIYEFGEEKRAEGRREAAEEHARMVRELANGDLAPADDGSGYSVWYELEQLAQAIEKGAK